MPHFIYSPALQAAAAARYNEGSDFLLQGEAVEKRK